MTTTDWDDEQIVERLSEWCQSHGVDITASGRNAAASILFYVWNYRAKKQRLPTLDQLRARAGQRTETHA